jgi:hypothetical protein
MPQDVQVGTVLIAEPPSIVRDLGLKSEPCSGNWLALQSIDAFVLDRKIHAAGWNFLFMAKEIKAVFLGAEGNGKLHSAIKRILGKAGQDFNCLQVTGIDSRSLLGVSYTVVSAHPRHIQRGCFIEDIERRQSFQQGV